MQEPQQIHAAPYTPLLRLLAEIIIEDAKVEESSACEPELAPEPPASE